MCLGVLGSGGLGLGLALAWNPTEVPDTVLFEGGYFRFRVGSGKP